MRDFLAHPNGHKSVPEPAREVPVLAECDVAVFGGGPAGVCAAAAAGRAGKQVVLVERYGFLGGMATAADVNVLHSLYGTDRKTRVIGGLAEEIIRRLQQRGAARNTNPAGESGGWIICSETAKFVLDDLVIGSGVRLLLHTWLADVIRDGRRIAAALVEGKSGRGAILANVYVDGTGDADLIRRAGVQTQLGDGQGRCQPPSLCFRVGGCKAGAVGLRGVQAELFKTPMDYNGQPYPTFLWGNPGIWDSREHMLAGTRVLGVNLADSTDLTRAEVEARYQLRWVLERLKAMPGWEDCYLVDVAAQIGGRESHRILADHQLTREEVLGGESFPDAVAQGTYPIDIHNPEGPGILFEHLDGTWNRIGGDGSSQQGRWDGQPAGAPPRGTLCYQVPYRSLVPRDLDNVLAAGRCAGANHDAAGAIRVMVNCMQLGQAAGAAAAITPPGASVRQVDAGQVQERLIEDDVPLRLAR
ncbi:MAG: hypothetical protein AMJ81_10215 [Phycisphaerae bacterium SM23_33]|nr:MAG: hypothetical protein AMJ81_10215 [Phycisphaerae bacterium SM23_33]